MLTNFKKMLLVSLIILSSSNYSIAADATDYLSEEWCRENVGIIPARDPFYGFLMRLGLISVVALSRTKDIHDLVSMFIQYEQGDEKDMILNHYADFVVGNEQMNRGGFFLVCLIMRAHLNPSFQFRNYYHLKNIFVAIKGLCEQIDYYVKYPDADKTLTLTQSIDIVNRWIDDFLTFYCCDGYNSEADKSYPENFSSSVQPFVEQLREWCQTKLTLEWIKVYIGSKTKPAST